MSDTALRLERFLARKGGLLPLQPCLVGRGYRGGGRLAGRGPGLARRRDGQYKVERWIASSTRAAWTPPGVVEGFSEVADFRPRLRFRDAVAALPEVMLGPRRAEVHQGEFRVLTKILDPFDPIGFHVHQSDEQVRADPAAFPGERFGKDEAYWFLPGPKGPWPYTHVGIWPGTDRETILRAMMAGRDALLEIGPYFLQRAHTGFFVPAGMVHSPGTMLTLEVQQPSDVAGGFGVRRPQGSGEATAEAMKAAEQQLRAVDLETCMLENLIERFGLRPEPIEPQPAGLQAWWIMPARVTRKFSAKRLRATAPCTCHEQEGYALLVGAGEGRLNGQAARAGDEFFVPCRTAVDGLRIEPAQQGLDLYAVFAAGD